jgi:hypothetical protein
MSFLNFILIFFLLMIGSGDALEYLLPGTRGACGQVMSYQVVNATTSHDLGTW